MGQNIPVDGGIGGSGATGSGSITGAVDNYQAIALEAQAQSTRQAAITMTTSAIVGANEGVSKLASQIAGQIANTKPID